MHISKSDLGAVIKAARLNRDFTQEALAEKVGVGARHIMAIENEGSYPSYEVLYQIIRELNIPPDRIFYPEKNPANPQLEYLSHLLGQCGDRDINAITAFVESLLTKPEDSN